MCSVLIKECLNNICIVTVLHEESEQTWIFIFLHKLNDDFITDIHTRQSVIKIIICTTFVDNKIITAYTRFTSKTSRIFSCFFHNLNSPILVNID